MLCTGFSKKRLPGKGLIQNLQSVSIRKRLAKRKRGACSMKQIKRNLHAEWEVISSAEWLEGLGRDPTNEEMLQIFEGSFYPLFNTKRVEPKQVWTLKITTYLECDDGRTSECEMEWKFDKTMSMHEVLNGAKHIKMNVGGIKTRWTGVTKNWIKN